jgi:poly-beta-1,6-N-acetyl-D-glucosamine synthase
MHSEATRYVIVSPVRDERLYIEETILSIARQTVGPVEWVIVDDGSTDGTERIIDGWSRNYPWIQTLHLVDRGFRQPGTGVMGAFHAGYRSLKSADWEFIIKLDGDLSLQPDYFERCFERFREDPKLGIAGGMLYLRQDGVLKLEAQPLFHVRGPTKIYRRLCWNAIGGLLRLPGWDTIDEVKANMLGWHTRSFPDLKVLHLRPEGAAEGTWRNAVKKGQANHVSGYHPLFMLLKCVGRVSRKPYVIDAAGHLWGFMSGALRGIPQVADPALICYLRQQQIRRLFGRETIWK